MKPQKMKARLAAAEQRISELESTLEEMRDLVIAAIVQPDVGSVDLTPTRTATNSCGWWGIVPPPETT